MTAKPNNRDIKKANDRERQKRLAIRRKKEGLSLVKLELSLEAVEQLEKLAEKLGFENAGVNTAGRIGSLSLVVNYAINQTLSNANPLDNKKQLELDHLYYVVNHLKDQGEGDSAIARYLSGKYPTPDELSFKNKTPIMKWFIYDVKYINNEANYQKLRIELGKL